MLILCRITQVSFSILSFEAFVNGYGKPNYALQTRPSHNLENDPNINPTKKFK